MQKKPKKQKNLKKPKKPQTKPRGKKRIPTNKRYLLGNYKLLKKKKKSLVITGRIHDIPSIFLCWMLHENIACPNA